MIAGYVYLIVNTNNGKKYVGCTKHPIDHRWKRHLREAKRGSPTVLHRAIRKHGAASFKITVLLKVKGGHSDLMKSEIQEIERQDCISPKGYNLTKGGDGVDFSVPETLDRLRQRTKFRSCNPSWRESMKYLGRKRASDPEWQRQHRALMKTPEWRNAQKEGARNRSKTTKWQQANQDARAKVLVNPVFRAKMANVLRQRAKDPSWLKKVTEINRQKPKDPVWKKAHAEGILRRSADPNWRDVVAKGAIKRNSDPNYRKYFTERMREIHAKRNAERDASLSPQEKAKREKNREYLRQWRARKKEK